MIQDGALSRRSVLQASAVATVGLALASHLPAISGIEEPASFAPNVFLTVEPDGTIIVTVGRSDMGQGVRTSLAMIIAEELDADWAKVKVVQAEADRRYGSQGTGGSGSVRGLFRPMRRVGATARYMLVAAAAKKWGVSPESCKTEKGSVFAEGRKATYGELSVLAAALPAPEDSAVALKDNASFKLIGTKIARVDNKDVVTGKAIYGHDVRIPGMKYAVVARPPAFGATVKSFSAEKALKVPGVTMVKQLGPKGVFVLAENTWAAIKGREKLEVTWELGESASLTSANIREDLNAALGDHVAPPEGSKVIEAIYSLPFLAHATMEPMSCVAEIKGDSVEIWAATQSPEQALSAAKAAAGTTNAKVNVTLLGGGFGRRLNQDFVAEAAALAKLAGHPVKVIWTRDDDMRNDGYRPCTVHSFKGSIQDAKPVFWSHQMAMEGGNGRGGAGRGAGIPYQIEKATMAMGGADHDIPFGFWRSVENSYLGFANESFIDELAHAAGRDPYEFRAELVKNERLKACLDAVAKLSNWGKPLPRDFGRGIACFSGYGSHIAQVVEVSVKGGVIKVDRAYAAVDCGICINPLGVEAQVQGATMDALSTTLLAAITIDKGGVVQESFSDYEWLRMGDAPKMEVQILPSTADPGGMGEVGYPAVPAALANAIFAATGRRFRDLPIGTKI